MAKLLLMRRSVPFITLLLLISLTVGTSPVLASSLTVQTNELAATKTSSLSSTLTTTSSRTSSSSSESSSRQKRRKRSTTESVERRLNTVFFHHKHKKYLQRGRKLEEYYEETYDDDIYQADTDDDSAYSQADELCSEFLVSFLEGTTDAHDTCEGIMNAYTAAACSEVDQTAYEVYGNDDYYRFENFAEHECCQALLARHSDYCENDDLISNFHLFVAASVLLVCECAKAMISSYNLHFLPEAGVCILVGTMFGLVAHILPFTDIDNISFDDKFFLSVLLPPIIFEAALQVSKIEFKRRRGAILMFSVLGTIISTFSTGLMVHYASKLIASVTTFPMLDSLVFGALISSIDPVAILSVLTGLNMDQKDTIFILVFGESLLNDGIAITVFQTLVDRFDGKTNDGYTSLDEILDAIATFFIAMFGSIAVGLACGAGAWMYFKYLGKHLAPVMEVGSFFLWALIPYYICDGIGWSGIVSIVVVAFFMDVYIAGPKYPKKEGATPPASPARDRDSYYSNLHEAQHEQEKSLSTANTVQSAASFESTRSMAPLASTERIHMSATADKHVRFVAHLTSQLAENAIFAYLGLFLFSKNYDWDPILVTISIVSCVLSRSIMVVTVSYFIFHIYKCRGRGGNEKSSNKSSRTAAAIRNPRTQAVLVLSGLRGAVSLALVENVPIYSSATGEGCEFKQLMKGMTSASILFTTFIFGGGAYYILPMLGIHADDGMDDSCASDDTNPHRRIDAVWSPPVHVEAAIGTAEKPAVWISTPSRTVV